jgi:hypothetical protein
MNTTSAPASRQVSWTGRIISGLVIAFLVMDAVMKLIAVPPVMDSMRELGFVSTVGLARCLGGLLLVCTALYAFPKTSAFGAILLTGFLGGTMAIHVRAGNPLFSHVLFGAYLAVMLWVGLLLRDRNLRAALVPTR